MKDENLFNALIELADDHSILCHRLGEWCGHAPILEEDLALTNMALDLIGTARNLYTYAAEIEGRGRSEDDLAYLRNERQFRNLLMVERPNGDFAHTMLRQLFFAAFMEPYWQAALESRDETLRGITGKAVKEMGYHIRHAGEWVIRLGDGTEESAKRMQAAMEALHIYVDELFHSSPAAEAAALAGLLPERGALRTAWLENITPILAEARLELPEAPNPQIGGRAGLHGEDLGHILCEMQYLQRSHPGATW